jgi:hypothetical protein
MYDAINNYSLIINLAMKRIQRKLTVSPETTLSSSSQSSSSQSSQSSSCVDDPDRDQHLPDAKSYGHMTDVIEQRDVCVCAH